MHWTADLNRISDLITWLTEYKERVGDLPVYTYSVQARCHLPLSPDQLRTGKVRFRRVDMPALMIEVPTDRGFRPNSR